MSQSRHRRTAMQERQGDASLPSPAVSVEALLQATVSVAWERAVHQARIDFLRRVAHPGEISLHVACGTDRLGFIDVAVGLTTILSDVEAASLAILAQQFADFERRLGPLTGRVQFRRLAVEALGGAAGFAAGSVHHLTLQNLFNTNLHPTAAHPGIIDALLHVIAEGGSCFITESEAAVLARQARLHGIRLSLVRRIQGYYDDDVVLLQVHKTR